MTPRSRIRKKFEPRAPRTVRKAPARCRPSVEALEERTLLTVSFSPAFIQNLSPEYGTQAVATGDFDGDGKLDVASANTSSGSISVLLGNGDGTLRPAGFYLPTASIGSVNPTSLSVGDFNGDGKLDLAAAADIWDVFVLIGNGDGTFKQPVGYGLANNLIAQFETMGDVNGDGKLDFVAVSTDGATGAVLLGNGDGTFKKGVSFPTATKASAAALGDFDGDGKLDLVTTGYQNPVVSVQRGNGDGTFQTAVSYGVQGAPNSVAVSDFNGDGKLDLVTANTSSNTISVLLGNGDGTFRTAVSYAVGHGTCTPWPWATWTTTAAPTSSPYHAHRSTEAAVSLSRSRPLARAAQSDPVTYTWTVYLPDGTTLTVKGANTNFVPPDNGSYGVSLTVTDDDGGSASATFSSGAMSWYRAEGNANDSAGTNNATIPTGSGVTFVAGKVGQAFSLDGVSGRVNLPNDFLPYPTTGTSTAPLSFETWFRTTSGGVILGQQAAGGSVPAVYVGTDGRLRAELFWGGSAKPIASTGLVNDGQWHHVAVTYNGASETVYLDGTAVGTTALTQTYAAGSTSINWGRAGRRLALQRPAGTDLYYFKGQIDEAGFYKSALSSADVQNIFRLGKGTATVAVANVAPTPARAGPSSKLAGQVVTYRIAANDPSSVDRAAGFAFTMNWGGSSPATVVARTAGAPSP